MYPVFLVHDLLFPLHQARCGASALLLCLGLEGSLGIRVIALTRDRDEIKDSPGAGSPHLLSCTLKWGRAQRPGGLNNWTASYQSLYPLLLLLLQSNHIHLCQGSGVQTDELCRYLEESHCRHG